MKRKHRHHRPHCLGKEGSTLVSKELLPSILFFVANFATVAAAAARLYILADRHSLRYWFGCGERRHLNRFFFERKQATWLVLVVSYGGSRCWTYRGILGSVTISPLSPLSRSLLLCYFRRRNRELGFWIGRGFDLFVVGNWRVSRFVILMCLLGYLPIAIVVGGFLLHVNWSRRLSLANLIVMKHVFFRSGCSSGKGLWLLIKSYDQYLYCALGFLKFRKRWQFRSGRRHCMISDCNYRRWGVMPSLKDTKCLEFVESVWSWSVLKLSVGADVSSVIALSYVGKSVWGFRLSCFWVEGLTNFFVMVAVQQASR